MSPELFQTAEAWARLVLEWVGFGTIVGLLAKAIMPGRDPGGAIATLAMGVAGTIIGCGAVSFFLRGMAVSPISPIGMAVGTAGAFVILFFYRMLAGRWMPDEERRRLVVRSPHRRRPQLEAVVVEHDD